jgi:glycosyltransferase involved in cell wall biosynthesis
MRILHIIPSLKKGGAERLCVNICNELNLHHGIEVKIILLNASNDFKFLTEDINMEVCTSTYRHHILKKDEKHPMDFDRIVNDFHPHIIHTHLFEADFFSKNFLKAGILYVTHLHGIMPQFENFSFTSLFSKKKFTGYFEKRFLLKKYDLCGNIFIANSLHTYDYYKNRLPANLTTQMHYLPNAIRLEEFPFTERKLHLEEIQLVSTGSLVENKNHSFLIDVVNTLRKSGRKLHLSILGEGLLRQTLQSKIDKLDLKSQVDLPGNRDQMDPWLGQATVYVHASKYESFGLSILEAMATGLPVVCLDGGGNRELIEDGKNGFILKQPSAEQFAEKILEIISDENYYQHFSRNAREKAEKYDLKEYADHLLSLYEEALKKR